MKRVRERLGTATNCSSATTVPPTYDEPPINLLPPSDGIVLTAQSSQGTESAAQAAARVRNAGETPAQGESMDESMNAGGTPGQVETMEEVM